MANDLLARGEWMGGRVKNWKQIDRLVALLKIQTKYSKALDLSTAPVKLTSATLLFFFFSKGRNYLLPIVSILPKKTKKKKKQKSKQSITSKSQHKRPKAEEALKQNDC